MLHINNQLPACVPEKQPLTAQSFGTLHPHKRPIFSLYIWLSNWKKKLSFTLLNTFLNVVTLKYKTNNVLRHKNSLKKLDNSNCKWRKDKIRIFRLSLCCSYTGVGERYRKWIYCIWNLFQPMVTKAGSRTWLYKYYFISTLTNPFIYSIPPS